MSPRVLLAQGHVFSVVLASKETLQHLTIVWKRSFGRMAYDESTYNTLLEKMGIRRRLLTSLIILVISTGGFHGNVASGPSPAGLADTLPAVLTQCASPVTVAQIRAAIWLEKWRE